MESPDFEILLFAYSVDGGPMRQIDLACGEKISPEILAASKDETVTKWAFNANFERLCLSHFLGYARRAFRTTKQLSKEKTTHAKDSFSVEETERLLSDLPNNLLGNSIRLMLVSGLRLQELLALTPNDIASDGSWVRVDKAVKMVNGIPKLGDPKSRTSRRVIPIAPKYRYIPRWLRENGGQAFLWCAPRQESLLYSIGSVRRKYYRLLDKYPDVRRLSPHCCRHTYVTLLQSQGVPLETIACLVGHSDIKTTGDYLHISRNTLEDAVTALESLI